MQSVLGKRTTSKISSQGWMAPVKISLSAAQRLQSWCSAQHRISAVWGPLPLPGSSASSAFSVGHLNKATSLDPLSHLHASLIWIKRFCSMNSSPWSHILWSKHLSSSFHTSIYSFGPHGWHTLSEVAVHLADKYFPVIEKRTSRSSGSCRAAV